MQSICPNCKNPVSAGDLICENCGYKLNSEGTGASIVRLIAAVILLVAFVSFVGVIAYSNIAFYVTSNGIITTPLFWKPSATLTETVTVTLTPTLAPTDTPTSTITLTPTETFTVTPTETFTPTLVPTSTITPSFTPSLTPVPSKTKVPSSTPKPSATSKTSSSTATKGVSSTATTGGVSSTATVSSAASLTPTIGALSDPVQFLRAYYNLINNRIYQEAWSWLTTDFVSSKSKGLGHTFSYDVDYAPYWNTVASVEILQASTDSLTTGYAQVTMQIRYNMLDGTNSVFNQRFFLVQGPSGRPWSIDSSDASN
jgi:hypothetical protein